MRQLLFIVVMLITVSCSNNRIDYRLVYSGDRAVVQVSDDTIILKDDADFMVSYTPFNGICEKGYMHSGVSILNRTDKPIVLKKLFLSQRLDTGRTIITGKTNVIIKVRRPGQPGYFVSRSLEGTRESLSFYDISRPYSVFKTINGINVRADIIMVVRGRTYQIKKAFAVGKKESRYRQ